MKEQQKEDLFRALGEVGSDLVDMAEKRTFAPRRWRRWGSIAAGLAVAVCLTALALPYFPSGCGASSENTEDYSRSAPDENEAAYEEETAAEGRDSAAAYDADAGGTTESPSDAEAGIRFAVDGVWYEIAPGLEAPLSGRPEDLGSVRGIVTEADWEELDGCTVYAAGGGSQAVYVQTADGYYYAAAVLSDPQG